MIGVGGSAAICAYGVFKWLGQQWLEQHFKKRLEELKHEQNKEIEDIRHRIQSMFSRISKIHEKEFECLPRAYSLMHEAHGKAILATGAGFKYYPDFTKMQAGEASVELEQSKLLSYQKVELLALAGKDRQTYYRKAMQDIELREAGTAQMVFHNYLVENRIFMNVDLRNRFNTIDSALHKSLTEYVIGLEADAKMRASGMQRLMELGNDLAALEKEIQKRLLYEEA